MKFCPGRTQKNDDEWYTPRPTADALAAWLLCHIPPSTPILCPADIFPDGTESTIPQALRAAGFTSVRTTRDLPLPNHPATWSGELIVTNPPFSH